MRVQLVTHPVSNPVPEHAYVLAHISQGKREKEGIMSGKIPRFVLDYWR